MGERFRTAKFYLLAIFTATLNMMGGVNMLFFSIACMNDTAGHLVGSGNSIQCGRARYNSPNGKCPDSA